ncbi:DUF3108 domain-containing protein [candidate division NPL-UPA2 bacterium]|nr:DUF3108 domain-containing protein [candidate division NPL-UPA2 bacterium]
MKLEKYLLSWLIGALILFLCQSVAIAEEKVPFSVGEKLTFRVIYFALPAGTATLEVSGVTNWEEKEVYQLVATVQSSALFSLFYRVRNRIESLIDTSSFLPYRYEIRQEEGDYRNHEVTIFNRDENIATTIDAEEKEGNPEGASVPVPADVQDALSSFYYLRRQNLEVGKSVFINVSVGAKNYQVEVKVLRKEELGKRRLRTIVVKPIISEIKSGGILEKKGDRDIYIWLTDDERRIPVLIKAEMAFGSLTMMLIDKELGK